MHWHGNTPYDFSLVSTYFPVLLLVVRSSICVSAIYWITSILGLPQQALLMFTVCIVYIDSLMMHDNSFDRACGHLCVCALAVLTQQQQQAVCSSSETVLMIVCDLLWSACAGVEVILRTTRVRMHGQQLNKTILCCCFACVRVAINCSSLGFMQAMCRTWLYNILCALLLLCSAFLPHQDGVLHTSSVVYICAHVLFVHLYAVIASVTLIVCVHARLVYLHVAQNGNTHKNDNVHRDVLHDSARMPPTVFPNTTFSGSTAPMQAQKDYSDLIKTLQAAKRASNVA